MRVITRTKRRRDPGADLLTHAPDPFNPDTPNRKRLCGGNGKLPGPQASRLITRKPSGRMRMYFDFDGGRIGRIFAALSRKPLTFGDDRRTKIAQMGLRAQLIFRDRNHQTTPGENMAFIVHADDSISTRLFAQWITERFPFSMDKFMPIQEPTIEKIMNDARFDMHYTFKGSYTNYFALNEEAMLILSQSRVDSQMERSEVYFEIFAKDIETYDRYYRLVNELDKASKLDTIIIEYHSFYQEMGHVDSNAEYFDKEIFDEVLDDFYAPYLDTQLLFEQFFKSRSVLLQLTGKPGLGKSKLISLFIKYLIEHPSHAGRDKVVKIARPASSDILASEEFWVSLRQEGFQALILDDVDHILHARNESVMSPEEKTHNEIIRKILTFTDGLTSQKSKILISTNLEYHKIDKALVRDARLFDSIELRALKPAEAEKIWRETFGLESNDFHQKFEGVEEITAAALAQTAESIRNDGSGGGESAKRSYLKEEGISKVEGLRTRKQRIGLV